MPVIVIDIELAHKWLNIDTYWNSAFVEDERLLQSTVPCSDARPRFPSKAEVLQVRKQIRELGEHVERERQRLDDERTIVVGEERLSEENLRRMQRARSAVEQTGNLTEDMRRYFEEQERPLIGAIRECHRRRREIERSEREWERQREQLAHLRDNYTGEDNKPFLPGSPLGIPLNLKKHYYPLDRRSDLRDESVETNEETLTLVEQLVQRIKDYISRGDYSSAREGISHIDKVCESMNRPRQTAEAKLEMAIALHRMGESERALAYLNQSLAGYRGADPHAEAITRWIMGHLQWLNPLNAPEAMVNWRKCYEMFASEGAERRSNSNPLDVVKWYRVRAEQMALNLEAAIRDGRPLASDEAPVARAPTQPAAESAASPAATSLETPTSTAPAVQSNAPTEPPSSSPPSPAGPAEPQSAGDSAQEFFNEALLRFRNIDIYESIPAHPAGGFVKQAADQFVEADRVIIDSRPHYLVNLVRPKSDRVISVNPGDRYSFVRVEGDSMNRARPCAINDGDYVLLRVIDHPDNGQIVAAVYADDIPGAPQCSLKRLKEDGLHSESAREHDIVPLERVSRYVGEAIAVAKPLRE